MSTTLASRYEPKEAEERWYVFWEQNGFAHPEPGVPAGSKAYSIVIPPPNVTGALHMGHALNNTLQDILVRWRRMQGYNTLWVPGTDHAGIATQAVVEKRIREQEHKTRHDLGRDELVRRIWSWKAAYEQRILNQLRRLGSSCDWKRTRFTLDATCARAVRETFFRMFRHGLIYRGKRLVNWDTQLQTSVADDETYTEDVPGGFWTFKYPVKGTGEFIRFSTTRPETMLGDTAVAVHPNDPRYRQLIGKTVTIPLVEREIPIIADGILADPELGTGCVKVTPAHDSNDYACWQRQAGAIGIINILNPDGTINQNGGPYAGLDRYVARDRVTEDMERLGLFEGREDREIPLKYSDRSKTPIEPLLSDQWFVRMGDLADQKPGLAEIAMQAVRDGRVGIHPERYAKTYLDWLGEKRDWCISRQLWWGHRIPVWSRTMDLTPDNWTGEFLGIGMDSLLSGNWGSPDLLCVRCTNLGTGEVVSDPLREFQPVVPANAGTYQFSVCLASDDPNTLRLLAEAGFAQDPDVLDTWFSSALWPHSTLGWPERTADLKSYYPTSTLVTSRDIITLWVARMVLTGLFNCGDVPFRDVYVHPKILDGFGQTMSKTKGNGVDPIDIIDKYGADALRFGLAYLTTESQDARMPVGYECPNCETYIAQKPEHQQMKPKEGRKPRIKCPSCKKDFQFSSPNFDPDPDQPVARVVSERFEQGRNFANKLWNAARFVLMNLEDYQPSELPPESLAEEDCWILSRLDATVAAMTEHLENFRFSEAARTVYDFAWDEFCDWYVEMAKLRLRDPKLRGTAQRVLTTVLDQLIRLLHPIMPFLTEHIWQAMAEPAHSRGLYSAAGSGPWHAKGSGPSIMIAAWPAPRPGARQPDVESRIRRLQDLIRAIRNIRSNFSIDPRTRVTALVRCSEPVARHIVDSKPFIELLAAADLSDAGPAVAKPANSVTAVAADWELYVPLTGLIDREAEIERNKKLLSSVESQLKSFRAKLANADFVSKAPPEVVDMHRQRESELVAQKASIEAILRELSGGS